MPMKITALVTGATRGIGRSMAIHLGRSGYQVAVNGTKETLIDEVVKEIRQTRLNQQAINAYCKYYHDSIHLV
jgi:3-oxoacyl-[acyl-carrier protein] reductase